jgi:bifunctional non-homologous end joining protein LigD
MLDQLSLQLPVPLPNLPATLRPMLAKPADEPFDSPDHLFEPSWGGARAFAFIEPTAGGSTAVRILDAGSRDISPFLPELADVGDRVAARSAILDGELVVADRSGRNDALALAGRLRGRPGPAVGFLVFDLVHLDGRPLLNMPLARRRELLGRIVRTSEQLVPVPAIVGEGRSLHAAAVEAGIAGVTGRVRRSPYLPGVRSRLWRFVGSSVEPAPVAGEDPPDAPAESAPVLALIRRLPFEGFE